MMIIIKLYKGKNGVMPVKRGSGPQVGHPQTSKPLSEETIRQRRWNGERGF